MELIALKVAESSPHPTPPPTPKTRRRGDKTMLLWTRDVQRRLFQEMAQDLALCARQKTPLRILARSLLRRADVAVLAVAVLTHERLRHVRHLLWQRLRRARADQVAQFAGLWAEWMAFLSVTHIVAQLILRA